MNFRTTLPALLPFFFSTLAYSVGISSSRTCTVDGISARCGDAYESVTCQGYSDPAYIANNQALAGLKLRSSTGELFYISLPKASVHDYVRALADLGQSGNFGSSAREESAMADIKKALHGARAQQLSIVEFSIDKKTPLYQECYSQKGVAKPSDRADNALDPNPLLAESGLTPKSHADARSATESDKARISIDDSGSSSGSGSAHSTGF